MHNPGDPYKGIPLILGCYRSRKLFVHNRVFPAVVLNILYAAAYFAVGELCYLIKQIFKIRINTECILKTGVFVIAQLGIFDGHARDLLLIAYFT